MSATNLDDKMNYAKASELQDLAHGAYNRAAIIAEIEAVRKQTSILPAGPSE